ncbi:ABC transporter permease [Alkalibacterium iburiense]|uniref:ABC transporter permease n=1 Tax=Alkalibacterium iburiense TaxID=290589 RepID=A0ABP3H9Z4_9LACT
MIVLAKRNMMIFFRDKANVFFSMLVVLITLGLYIIFLGENLTSGMTEVPNAGQLVDTWIMAGILATTSLTTTLGAFGIMVNDRDQKVDKDFLATPLSYAKRVAGYLLGTFSIGLIMTLLTLILAQAFIYFNHDQLFTVNEFIQLGGIMLLSVLSSTAMMYVIVELFRSPMAYETATSVISSIIGFVAGVYVPFGVLPRVVQYFAMLFPVTHGAALFRQVMMGAGMDRAFEGVPVEVIQEFELTMGSAFQVGDTILSPTTSLIYLAVTTVIFYGLAVLLAQRKKR